MKVFAGISALAGLLMLCGCYGDPHHSQPARETGPAIIQLRLPAGMGHSDRPAVEFDHQAHTRELEPEGCTACHRADAQGQLLPHLKLAAVPIDDDDDWMEQYHDLCIGCHDDRLQARQKTGPDDCGDCHLKQPAPRQDVDRTMRFDYSLHYRHQRAYQDRCEACHHVFDEQEQKLVYRKGAEDACSACHRSDPEEGETSLADAVHTACVNCHIQRQGQGKATGPQLCAGCHGQRERAAIEKVKDAPHIDRGQPQAMWMATQGVDDGAVPFEHRLHEAQVDSCSACHHESIGKCGECHTRLPDLQESAVTLSRAYHQADSTLSCVGCHQERSGEGLCIGCHHVLPVPPGQAACDRCHTGPPAEAVDPDSSPMEPLAPVQLAALPAFSDRFPETVQIGVLADQYGPSRFPHGRIVATLDRVVRDSRLARRFHGETETLCAGCHHNSPPGAPVYACRSCHGDENVSGKDQPGLYAAYHRQCIGCHQAIGHPAQGCTDCHQEASE